ncbi:unnamed protein product [Caenorhabditis auriculariae]|uniref:Lipase n=1 Tax=Caenorhabditis auriculariae TaxID=2777116 RepID=A0A8S1HED8_9PELO|nr:unnamed protein product [Caenorhabditis auriculariae]
MGFALVLVLLALIQNASAKDLDPEIFMDVMGIIKYWGYPVESHTTVTSDGYILTMHRIPNGKNSGPNWPNGKKPAVFLQHGLLGDSSHYVGNLPGQSAAYMFADAGFDVWMGNMRGNTYSKNHTSLSPKNNDFWRFSWDEMGALDLEAMIDKVLEITAHDSLYYVGHSQGTLTMFSKLSLDNGGQFSKKIKKFFAYAPVSSVKNIEGGLAYLAHHFSLELDAYYAIFGSGDFLPDFYVMKMVSEYVCGGMKIEADTCDNFLFLIGGPESNQWNETRVPVYISQMPAGTSSQNMIHWLQMVQHGGIPMFNFGTKGNKAKYGQATPPQYDFSKIAGTQIYLYWSPDDWLADEKDILAYLLPKLSSSVLIENNRLEHFNHLDFIWGLNATELIYQPTIDICTKDYLNQ